MVKPSRPRHAFGLEISRVELLQKAQLGVTRADLLRAFSDMCGPSWPCAGIVSRGALAAAESVFRGPVCEFVWRVLLSLQLRAAKTQVRVVEARLLRVAGLVWRQLVPVRQVPVLVRRVVAKMRIIAALVRR